MITLNDTIELKNIEAVGGNMNWNKLRKQLESFLAPSLSEIVSFSPSGYRYSTDKKIQCYLLVHKKEVLNTKLNEFEIKWYQNEQEVKNDLGSVFVTAEELEAVRKNNNGNIPEDRLKIMARKQKSNVLSKEIFKAQNNLFKNDFQKIALTYLSTSLDECLKSEDIILNILALMDRRVGKKRLQKISSEMKLKHPAVYYFYILRRDA